MIQEADETGWIGRVRRSHIVVTMAALGGLVVGIASTTEAIDKIAIWTGLKPNALQLAADDARARFSRELSRAAWYRYYLMFRYLALVKGKNPESDRERVWNKYQEALEDWNRDLVLNELSLRQYYGGEKSSELKHRIQPQFSKLHSCLEGLHAPQSTFPCPLSPGRSIPVIEKGLDHLRHDIYCFVMGFPETNAAPGEPAPRECLSGGSS